MAGALLPPSAFPIVRWALAGSCAIDYSDAWDDLGALLRPLWGGIAPRFTQSRWRENRAWGSLIGPFFFEEHDDEHRIC